MFFVLKVIIYILTKVNPFNPLSALIVLKPSPTPLYRPGFACIKIIILTFAIPNNEGNRFKWMSDVINNDF